MNPIQNFEAKPRTNQTVIIVSQALIYFVSPTVIGVYLIIRVFAYD